MTAYYNEHDPYAAQWLRNLIDAGHIARGDVDERPVQQVRASDLNGYTQCHFFAGIGVWSYALRLAGWPDDRAVWTGSCPCQPFSAAGKRKGLADERHLWPTWFGLIRECHPHVVFGEQVASSDGLGWMDAVSADLEGEGYACGALDTCAAGFGAPHIRQRLYWVADATGARPQGSEQPRQRPDAQRAPVERSGEACGLADPNGRHSGAEREQRSGQHRQQPPHGGACHPWAAVDWLPCRDGRHRPTQPGLLPLAHGAAARVGRLRAYGNAIVAQQAAAFIHAYMTTK